MLRRLHVVLLCCLVAGTNAIASENRDYVNLMQRGRTEYLSGHFAASEAAFLAALRTLQPSNDVERAATLDKLADVYVNEDELSKAERAYLECRAIYERLSDKKNVAVMLRNLGALYSLQHRDDEALKVLQLGLKLAKSSPGVSPALVPQVLNSFGVVYFRQGKYKKAESFLNQALQAASASGVLFETQHALQNLGAVYIKKRDFKKAEEFLKQGLKMAEAEVGPNHPDLTFGLSSLATLYAEIGNYPEAENQYQRALQILQPHKSNFDTRTARLLHGLSRTYAKAGKKTDADAALSQAAIIARRNLAEHPDMADIVDDYSSALKKQGKPKEAEELRVEARRARVTTGLVINAHNWF